MVMLRFTSPPKRRELAIAATGALKRGAARISSRPSVFGCVVMVTGVLSGETVGSGDQCEAKRGEGETLQDGASVDDSVPIGLQDTHIRQYLAAIGGGGELSVDRRTHAGVEQQPDRQQHDGHTGRDGLSPVRGERS